MVSPGLTSASSSKVMRVTSLLEELRARLPLAFLVESHLRLTNVTRQLLQGCPPPADAGQGKMQEGFFLVAGILSIYFKYFKNEFW